jgi:hypothetical protein
MSLHYSIWRAEKRVKRIWETSKAILVLPADSSCSMSHSEVTIFALSATGKTTMFNSCTQQWVAVLTKKVSSSTSGSGLSVFRSAQRSIKATSEEMLGVHCWQKNVKGLVLNQETRVYKLPSAASMNIFLKLL